MFFPAWSRFPFTKNGSGPGDLTSPCCWHQLLKNIKAKPSFLRPRVLRRVRETIPQTELPYPERLNNPDDAFAVGDSLPPGTILLIDDVMTTGSTLNAAARTLKASGAERVSAWVLCRSVIGKDSRDLIQ